MNFLEKDLETIIWENYVRCKERGLTINQAFYSQGKQYRQLNLSPYGIADLVYVRYFAPENAYYAQIVELKKGKVDTAAYQQAKRYQTALLNVLRRANSQVGKAQIYLTTILIGSEVEMAGDFLFVLNADVSCSAFTFSYGFDGIQFEEVGRQWQINNAESSAQLESLVSEFAAYREELDQEYADNLQQEQQELADDRQARIQAHGDYLKALLITSEGVLVNEELLENDLEEAVYGDQ